MPAGYWVKRLQEVPLVPGGEPDDFDWYPIQHHFGLTAFGANVFGGDTGISLVAEHDETESGQEEMYAVVRGAARFTLDGESCDAVAISVVAIPDRRVRRAAVAIEDGTLVLAVGGVPGSFASTWQPQNFEHVPVAD